MDVLDTPVQAALRHRGRPATSRYKAEDTVARLPSVKRSDSNPNGRGRAAAAAATAKISSKIAHRKVL